MNRAPSRASRLNRHAAWRHARLLALAATGAWHAATGWAADAPPAAPTADEQRMADEVLRAYDHVLRLSPDLKVSPDTRQALEGLLAGNRERFRGVALRWAREERPATLDIASLGQWQRRLQVRLSSELAAWRLLPATPAHDDALMAAWLRPTACSLPEKDHAMDFLAAAIDQVPAADRPAVLEGERAMLARWGSIRPDELPPPPQPSLRDEQRAMLQKEQARDADGLPPLPPVLAHLVFAEEPAVEGAWARCAFNQWWMRQQLAHPPADREALRRLWRWTQVMDAAAFERAPVIEGEGGDATYPPVAQAWGVEGQVAVAVDVDAQGRFVRGTVQRRDLTIDGLRPGADLRYFTTLLDDASLARARASWKPTPQAASSPDKPRRMIVNWSLK